MSQGPPTADPPRTLGPKLADYEQAGVLEYIVRAMRPDELPDNLASTPRSQS